MILTFENFLGPYPSPDMEHSTQPTTQQCTICDEIIGAPRPDETTETAQMLPCSHIFGSICIARWLNSTTSDRKCPNCRRKMVYSGCGHPIKPRDVEKARKPVSKDDMPEKCLVCRTGGEVESQIKVMRERQAAEERALRGLKMYLPGGIGGVRKVAEEDVDERIEESKEVWRKEIEALIDGLGRDEKTW